MASTVLDENEKRDTDEDNITKRLNKAFESRLDLDRVSLQIRIVHTVLMFC